jgi:sodium/hydrogen antiporter
VESGYNDGIFSPVFAFAVIVIEHQQAEDAGIAVEEALLGAGVALVAGLLIGGLCGFLVRLMLARGWAGLAGVRVVMVLVPVVTYFVASELGGNGFVAAFLAGIAYKLLRSGRRDGRTDIPHQELTGLDDFGTIAALIMWFVFGAVSVIVFELGFVWSWILFAVLALTVARLVPVFFSLIGSRSTALERVQLGLLGPRGTSSIVFGLLAYNAMEDDDADMAIYVMVVVVLGSLLLHGVAARFWGRRSRSAAVVEPAPER